MKTSKIMKIVTGILLAALCLVSSCSLIGSLQAVNPDAVVVFDPDARAIQDAMISTVMVQNIQIATRSIIVRGHSSPVFVGPVPINQGSGFVVGVDEKTKTSVVMTAQHVVDGPASGQMQITIENDIATKVVFHRPAHKVTSYDGTDCNAQVIRAGGQRTNDMSLLLVDCIIGPPVTIAKSLPPFGGRIFIVGVPDGEKPDIGFMTLEGRFAGIRDGYGIYSVPIAGGVSGSPVFYKGEVVGMAARVNQDFHHIALSVNAQSLQEFIEGR